jgi:hypothetical protein
MVNGVFCNAFFQRSGAKIPRTEVALHDIFWALLDG